jgi:hypothetical protein
MDKNNFDNKENLGHGIKGDVNTDAKNLKNEKNNKNNKVNNLRSNKNFEN